MKLSIKNRNLLVTLLLAGGTLAYVFLLFLPTQRATSQLYDQLLAEQNYVTQSQALDNSIREVEAKLTSAREFANHWQSSAPSPQAMAPTFGAITRAASEAQVEMLSFDPQETDALESITRAPVALSCTGTFPQVFRFLQHLESLDHTIWVEDLQLTASREAPNSVRCELTLAVFADNHKDSD